MGEAVGIGLSVGALRAYQALCSFCSWALLEGHDEEGVRRLADTRELLLDEPFATVAPQAAHELHDALEVAASAGEVGVQELLRKIRLDHTYLFSMTGQSRTTPYESVYRTDDATMFGPTTLQVRAAYLAHGLMFERCANEPDDHAGLEFAFLSHLLGKAADEAEAHGDAAFPASLPPLRDAASFLSEHLLVFAPLYCENMKTRASTPYYRALAAIAAGTLESLSCALGAKPSETIDVVRYMVTK